MSNRFHSRISQTKDLRGFSRFEVDRDISISKNESENRNICQIRSNWNKLRFHNHQPKQCTCSTVCEQKNFDSEDEASDSTNNSGDQQKSEFFSGCGTAMKFSDYEQSEIQRRYQIFQYSRNFDPMKMNNDEDSKDDESNCSSFIFENDIEIENVSVSKGNFPDHHLEDNDEGNFDWNFSKNETLYPIPDIMADGDDDDDYLTLPEFDDENCNLGFKVQSNSSEFRYYPKFRHFRNNNPENNSSSTKSSSKFYTSDIETDDDDDDDGRNEREKLIKSNEENNREMQKYYYQGIQYREDGMFEEAISCFKKIIEFAPRNITGYNSRGYTNLTRKLYRTALADFKICVELDPGNTVVLLNKAKTHIHLDEYMDAIRDYETIIKTNPEDSRGYNGKGVCLRKLGYNDEAMNCFLYSTKLKTHPNEPLVNRAIVNTVEGNHGDAIEDLTELIRMSDGNLSNQLYLNHLREGNVDLLKGKIFNRNVPRNKWGF